MNDFDFLIELHRGAVPFAIVKAVIWKESGFDQWAIRAEPQYRYMWDVRKGQPFRKLLPEEVKSLRAPKDFPAMAFVSPDTEWWSQRMSFGLMQVMGAVARELGYAGKFLTQLSDPDLGVRFGCEYLNRLLARYDDASAMLAAYNGGPGAVRSNGQHANLASYVRPVLERVKTYG